MRFPNKALLLLGSLLLVARTGMAVPANLKENYQPIIDRNPFGLKPPPPPPTNNTAPPVQKPKVEIFMTGIVSIGYPKRPKQVFLMTKEQNKKDANYYALTEGVEKDGIKVLAIDEVNKKVRINTDVGETMLTFQTHGIAAPAVPAMPIPGQPGVMPVPGRPGAVPLPLPGGAAGQQQNQFPQGQPAAMGGNPAANSQNSFRSIPSRSVRSRIPAGTDVSGGGSVSAIPGVQGQEQQPQMDPAEQYLRMHLDKAQKERQGIQMPPLPVIQ